MLFVKDGPKENLIVRGARVEPTGVKKADTPDVLGICFV